MMKKPIKRTTSVLPIELVVPFNTLTQHVAQIQAYFSSMSLKLQDHLTSAITQPHQQTQSPIQSLIHLISDFNHQIHLLIRDIYPMLDTLQNNLIEKWQIRQLSRKKQSVFQIPVELQKLQLDDREKQEIIERYVADLKCYDDLPLKLKEMLVHEENAERAKVYEIPVELKIEEDEQCNSCSSSRKLQVNKQIKEIQNAKSRRGQQTQDNRQYLVDTAPVNLTFQTRNITKYQQDPHNNNNTPQSISQDQTIEIPHLNLHTIRINEISHSEIKTASFYDEDEDPETPQLREIGYKEEENQNQFPSFQNTEKFFKRKTDHDDNKYSEIRPKQLNKRVSQSSENILYQVPPQLAIPLPDKLQLSSQVYSLAIDSKSNASPQDNTRHKVQDQELTFSQHHNYVEVSNNYRNRSKKNSSRKKSENQIEIPNQGNGLGIFSKNNNYGRLSETNLLVVENLALENNKASFDSYSDQEFLMSPRNNEHAPHNNNMNWSASIQSFLIGANNATKNLNDSENYPPEMKKGLPISIGESSSRLIEEQSNQEHDNPFYLRIPATQTCQNSPINKDNLTQHPQLNFCGSSQINEHNSPNGEASKTSSFLKSVQCPQNSLSLKFKESCIVPEVIRNKCIDPTGSVYGSLAEFKINREQKRQASDKKNNKVYIIEAESSSEGSHTDRQMFVSNIKKNNITSTYKNMPSKTVKNSSSSSSSRYRESQEQRLYDENVSRSVYSMGQNFKENQQNILVEYYELKQMKVILQEQKIAMLDQLQKYEEQIEELKKDIDRKEQQKQGVEQGFQRKCERIKELFSEYENKLKDYENQLKQKLYEETSLKKQIQHHQNRIHQLEANLQSKDQIIHQLQVHLHNYQTEYNSEKQIFQKSKSEKEDLLASISHEYVTQTEILAQEVKAYKFKNACLMKEIEKYKEEIEEKTQKIEEKKNQYNELFGQLQTILSERDECDQKRFWEIYKQQLEKVHEKYEKSLQQKTIAINKLESSRHELSICVQEKNKKITELQERIASDDQIIQELGLTLGDNIDLNSQMVALLPKKAKQQIQYLRKQLIQTTYKFQSSQNLIQQLKAQLSPKIQIIQQEESPPSQSYQSVYVKSLQGIICQYEQIIMKNYFVIQELQDRVYEYLKDALKKEEIEEKLYGELLDSENQLNEMVLQKIAVQVENKRMKKMIVASQKKLSSIGTRLINAAKTKLKDFSRQTSNQTQKPFRNTLQAATSNKMITNKIKRTSSRETIQDILIDTMTK